MGIVSTKRMSGEQGDRRVETGRRVEAGRQQSMWAEARESGGVVESSTDQSGSWVARHAWLRP